MSQRCSTPGSVFTLSSVVPRGYRPLPSIHLTDVCESLQKDGGVPDFRSLGCRPVAIYWTSTLGAPYSQKRWLRGFLRHPVVKTLHFNVGGAV